jgi:excisionase family DNA binding protein
VWGIFDRHDIQFSDPLVKATDKSWRRYPWHLRCAPLELDTMEKRLLTIAEVAKYLNVDKFTVYRLVTTKKLPAFKVGAQWRFKKEMIDSWLEGNSNLLKKRKDH